MKYALLIYAVPGASENPGPAPEGGGRGLASTTRPPSKEAGRTARRGSSSPGRTPPPPSGWPAGGTAAHRRAVRRDQGAPARLLLAGGRQPRRGAGLGGQDAHHALRHRGGAAGAGKACVGRQPWGVIPPPALERAFREEWTTVGRGLSRRLGDLSGRRGRGWPRPSPPRPRLWRRDGVPPSPGAWLPHRHGGRRSTSCAATGRWPGTARTPLPWRTGARSSTQSRRAR